MFYVNSSLHAFLDPCVTLCIKFVRKLFSLSFEWQELFWAEKFTIKLESIYLEESGLGKKKFFFAPHEK